MVAAAQSISENKEKCASRKNLKSKKEQEEKKTSIVFTHI